MATDRSSRKNSTSRLEHLNKLVGEWKMEAYIEDIPLVHTKTTFNWFENQAFLIQRTFAEPPLPTTPRLWIENNPNPIVAIIGFDDFSLNFYYVYTDVRGVRRVYPMSMDEKVWKFWGQAAPQFFQRFEGKISADNNMIDATIEKSPDGKNWELDFNAQYKRI